MLKNLPLLGLTALLAATSGAWANGPPAPTDVVKADIVADITKTSPRKTDCIDLQLIIKQGGISIGRTPETPACRRRSTGASAKVSAGHILWPVPEHFVQNGIGNTAMPNRPISSCRLRRRKELAAGQTALIKAEASWLVCADICIPGSATSLNLPVAARPPSQIPPLRRSLRRPAGSCGPGAVRDPLRASGA